MKNTIAYAVAWLFALPLLFVNALHAEAKGGSSASSRSGGSHSVRGHVRKDGTYVAPHRQTNRDSSKTNNWSSKGNINPNTGKEGTQDPYRPRNPQSR
jgi:hypothetical protein